jgi:flagellar hook-length control protein FliK
MENLTISASQVGAADSSPSSLRGLEAELNLIETNAFSVILLRELPVAISEDRPATARELRLAVSDDTPASDPEELEQEAPPAPNLAALLVSLAPVRASDAERAETDTAKTSAALPIRAEKTLPSNPDDTPAIDPEEPEHEALPAPDLPALLVSLAPVRASDAGGAETDTAETSAPPIGAEKARPSHPDDLLSGLSAPTTSRSERDTRGSYSAAPEFALEALLANPEPRAVAPENLVDMTDSRASASARPSGEMQADPLISAVAGLPIPSSDPGIQRATLRLESPVGSVAWNEDLGQRVTWLVAKEQSVAELQLNPPDFGPVEVVLAVEGEKASALFVSAQPALRDAIESALPRLRDMLADAGIRLENATVSADGSGQQTPGDRPPRSGHSAPAAFAGGGRELRAAVHDRIIDIFA